MHRLEGGVLEHARRLNRRGACVGGDPVKLSTGVCDDIFCEVTNVSSRSPLRSIPRLSSFQNIVGSKK